MLDQMSYELDNYVAATEISAYLDGIRDGIETFFFGNTSDDIVRQNDRSA